MSTLITINQHKKQVLLSIASITAIILQIWATIYLIPSSGCSPQLFLELPLWAEVNPDYKSVSLLVNYGHCNKSTAHNFQNKPSTAMFEMKWNTHWIEAHPQVALCFCVLKHSHTCCIYVLFCSVTNFCISFFIFLLWWPADSRGRERDKNNGGERRRWYATKVCGQIVILIYSIWRAPNLLNHQNGQVLI